MRRKRKKGAGKSKERQAGKEEKGGDPERDGRSAGALEARKGKG